MRSTLFLLAAVVLLAVPTAALADGGSTSSTAAAKRLVAKKAKKPKKLHVELKRAGAGTARRGRTATRELDGTVTSVSPLTVTPTKQGVAPLTCDVPAGISLTGLQVGDRVEITCDLVGDRWTLRKLEQKGHPDAGAGSTQGPTATCDDDSDDDSGTLDDHDEDCGQLSGDDDHGDDDHGDDDD